MPKPTIKHSRYMAGLDGLRAIAVLAVIAYHLNLNWAPGGLLGVGIFFVLSGYLITDILLTQWKQSGNLDLKDFWLRRAKRLLPALLSMLLLVIFWVFLFARPHFVALRGDLLPALFYVSNWWLIFHHVSYFASFGPASPLGHLWSLAVEEQFYLLWPLIVMLGLRFIRKRGLLVGITLVLTFASASAMVLLYQPGSDPSRVYYGTDTRAFGLLIGAVLACIWPSQKLAAFVTRPVRFTIDVIGLIGLTIMIVMIHTSNEYDASLYRGGLVILSIAAAMAVAALAHPASRIGRIFGWKPLRWIGVRSYGIYLWHYPVIILTSPSVDTGGVHSTRAVLQILTSITLAALSWKFIENPIRHGAIATMLSQSRIRGWWLGGRWTASMLAVLILIVSCVSLLTWPIQDATASSKHTAIAMTSAKPASAASNEPTTKSELLSQKQPKTNVKVASNHTPASNTNSHPLREGSEQAVKLSDQRNNLPNTKSESNATKNTNNVLSQGSPQAMDANTGSQTKPGNADLSATQSNLNQQTALSKTDPTITAIGDSVMVDIAPFLEKLLPGIDIDGKIGRQLYQAQDVVAALKSKNELGNVVIIELGTNGSFTKDQLESLLKSFGNVKQIVMVNTRVPRPWESVVNSTLADVAATFPNTTLVDWYQASANHDSYFYPDGVHLNQDGATVYATLVAKAIHIKKSDS